MCLYGFTRLEPAPTASEGNLEEIQLAVRGAPIAERTHWLPAIEQFGEGIFIRFDPTPIEIWQERDQVRRRIDALIDGYDVIEESIRAWQNASSPARLTSCCTAWRTH